MRYFEQNINGFFFMSWEFIEFSLGYFGGCDAVLYAKLAFALIYPKTPVHPLGDRLG